MQRILLLLLAVWLCACDASFTQPEERNPPVATTNNSNRLYIKTGQTLRLSGYIDFNGKAFTPGKIIVAWEVPSLSGYIIYGSAATNGAIMPHFSVLIPDSLPRGIVKGSSNGDSIAVGHIFYTTNPVGELDTIFYSHWSTSGIIGRIDESRDDDQAIIYRIGNSAVFQGTASLPVGSNGYSYLEAQENNGPYDHTVLKIQPAFSTINLKMDIVDNREVQMRNLLWLQ